VTLLDLFDDPPAQPHSVTSQDAAEAIRPDAARLRGMVFAVISGAGTQGMTDEEGIDQTQISPSTYRPRRVELVQSGQVRDSGRTRKTASGRKAVVWVSTAAEG
jgi:hypothetical protein